MSGFIRKEQAKVKERIAERRHGIIERGANDISRDGPCSLMEKEETTSAYSVQEKPTGKASTRQTSF